MHIFYWILGLLFTLIVAIFYLSNEHTIILHLDILKTYKLDPPLSIYTIVVFVLGVLVGGIYIYISEKILNLANIKKIKELTKELAKHQEEDEKK